MTKDADHLNGVDRPLCEHLVTSIIPSTLCSAQGEPVILGNSCFQCCLNGPVNFLFPLSEEVGCGHIAFDQS